MLKQQQGKNNQLLVPQVDHMLDLMKQEIAEEFGVELGADATARDNGRVGGELVRRLILLGQEQLNNKNNIH